MARKTRRRRRARHSGAPRRRRRRMSGSASAPVIGKRASHRRRRRSHVSGPHRRRRHRVHGSRGKDAIMEYLGLTVGTGVGLVTGELLSGPMNNTIGNLGSAAVKTIAGLGTFAVGEGVLKSNSLVKGIGIGLQGSAINDGIRALRSAGIINGPADMIIEIKDNGGSNKMLTPGQQQYQLNGPGIIGRQYEQMPLNY